MKTKFKDKETGGRNAAKFGNAETVEFGHTITVKRGIKIATGIKLGSLGNFLVMNLQVLRIELNRSGYVP